jgi:predicted TIM-barrel fold metal-dependent hydrolase
VATPGAPNKFFMVSSDCHVNEPVNLWRERIEKKYQARLPRIEVDEFGKKWIVIEGQPKRRSRDVDMEGEDEERRRAGGPAPEQRLKDHARDGIDAEIIFHQLGGIAHALEDAEFAMAMCRVSNDWAWEVFGPYNDRLSPAAGVTTIDVNLAIQEVYRTAKMGFRCFALPVKPVYDGKSIDDPNYNLPMYDPLWAAIQETGLPMVFHVGSGKDPRTARGNGGAIINYAVHALAPASEPVACLCTSGVFDRFPGLRFATIESGIGWVPWLLEAMDEAYMKHHFWVRPKLKMLPSEYYKKHGGATFQEDRPGLSMAREFGLVDNFMWGNDYPHHEGTWPHSAEAIERQMGHLTEDERAKILGLNGAKFFGFKVPDWAK